MAAANDFGYKFTDPLVASVRIPIYTNEDGDIAITGDDRAGTKSFTFTYTPVTATANEILYGDTTTEGTNTGLVGTFITYLLDASFEPTGIKRTVVQNTEARTSIDDDAA